MEESLALALHQAALELYRLGSSGSEFEHGLAHGHLKNANQDANVGTIAGPVFEAELETERGKGAVRFILTRQGLEAMNVQQGASARRYVN